jgi:TusA-related sulfurtransferase
MDAPLDARGQACPTPVLRTKQRLETTAPATLTVLVDEPVAVENISRLARNSGYDLTVHAEAGHTRLDLVRKALP